MATPLSSGGSALLDDVDRVEVEVDEVPDSGARLVTGAFTVEASLQGKTNPSGAPLAVAVSIDQSGSMIGTDPDRLRIEGAIAFVDVLENLGVDYEAGIFAFGPIFSFDPDRELVDTDILSPYTDRADSARAAIRRAEQETGTPTYESLIEVLTYSEAERPTDSFERAVVLLSDGSPNSTARRQEACDLASEQESPVYAIGLGPASDVSEQAFPGAVEEMRAIAQCTGGAYAGIGANEDGSLDAASIQQIYRNVAVGTAQGNVSVRVQLGGDGFDALSPGDRISGRLSLGTENGSTTAPFAFTVPQGSEMRSVQWFKD